VATLVIKGDYMKLGLTLLDKASEMCGSDAELARKMGVNRQEIYALRKGRTVTPEVAAELADIAGVDPLQAMADAVIERNKGTRRETVLREILGKAVAAGVAAVLLFFYSADLTSAMAHQKQVTYSQNGITTMIKLAIHRIK
jgi:transcriptional regulator with XRE-family HTH domain